MGSKKKTTHKQVMTSQEAAEFLHHLADGLSAHRLELGDHGPGLNIGPDAQVKIKYTGEVNKGRAVLRLGLKLQARVHKPGKDSLEPPAATQPEVVVPAEDRPAAQPSAAKDQRPSFKVLKKRMQKELGAVSEGLRDGRLPSGEQVEALAMDCRLMTQYNGKGEAMYGVFLQRVDALLAAAGEQDSAALEAAVAALKQRKRECHKQYK